ncbi:MAG: 1-acyl-sn-glycerol-3-phosphate acyltransferase [Thermoproteota archaeon]|jgi:1-acyl-sn-glycerol-3-phosphate acyltransferase
MFKSLNYKNDIEAKAKIDGIFKELEKRYSDYKDPWGFDLDACKKAIQILWPLYNDYFKVRVFGTENVQDKPYLLCSNHSGQLPIDGLLVTMAMLLETDKPRVCRGMVEKFLAGLPFLGDLAAQVGSILGDRKNATYLLQQGESLLVFPEGVRGISKNTSQYYKLQDFTRGFFRIALQAKVDILPICVVGAEEMFPFVYHMGGLAKLLKVPSLPLTPNLLPLPSPIDIYIGEPYEIPKDLSPDAPDKEINEHVYKIQRQIKQMMAVGLKERRQFFDGIRKPLRSYFRSQQFKKE